MPTDTLAETALNNSIVYLGLTAALFILGVVVFYVIIKAAVCNGMLKAYEQMGIDADNYQNRQ